MSFISGVVRHVSRSGDDVSSCSVLRLLGCFEFRVSGLILVLKIRTYGPVLDSISHSPEMVKLDLSTFGLTYLFGIFQRGSQQFVGL